MLLLSGNHILNIPAPADCVATFVVDAVQQRRHSTQPSQVSSSFLWLADLVAFLPGTARHLLSFRLTGLDNLLTDRHTLWWTYACFFLRRYLGENSPNFASRLLDE